MKVLSVVDEEPRDFFRGPGCCGDRGHNGAREDGNDLVGDGVAA